MDEDKGYRWEGAYEKTWETLNEDEEGSFEASVANYVHAAKRKRMLERKSNVKLGIMRHVYLVLDLSQAMNEKDLLPSRQTVALRALDSYLEEFFDQNPISQIGIIVTREKRAEKLSELSGDVRKHREVLKSLTEIQCSGEPSLQNAFELALNTLKDIPSHASREILVIQAGLTSCDPGNIYSTIELLTTHKIRCSIIGLSAEVHVCKVACKETGGAYNVVLDQKHLKDLLSFQTTPPTVKYLDSKLLRMGFPEHKFNVAGEVSLCTCHADITGNGYFCPQCRSKYCSLPTECKVCGLTLVLAPHLSRSYHHLFPMRPFSEKTLQAADGSKQCYACFRNLAHKAYSCEKCQQEFCTDCELFIQESMHLCPGCL